ncbi:hypothetical protein BDD12DRAFT_806559 [Trichophaea hybrida]|nr:hypothetical protein BDD12DRAFT_806559 [Trichophaea hybrida]
MPGTSPDIVHDQLLELEQQIKHVIEACNQGKGILEEEFKSGNDGIQILESRLRTERQKIGSDVSGVGTPIDLHQSILSELWQGVVILRGQNNQIVSEASELFQGSRAEMDCLSQRITDNVILITTVQNSIKKINDNISLVTKTIDGINTIMTAITKSLKEVPSTRELRDDTAVMEEQMFAIQEVITGLTIAMTNNKLSESTPFNFQTATPFPGRVRGGAGEGNAAEGAAGNDARGAGEANAAGDAAGYNAVGGNTAGGNNGGQSGNPPGDPPGDSGDSDGGDPLQLRFEDEEAGNEAYGDLEKVRYGGFTGPAFKKLILDRLPNKILEEMHTVDLTGRTNKEIFDIITKAGKTTQQWEAARKNLALRSLGNKASRESRFIKLRKEKRERKQKFS